MADNNSDFDLGKLLPDITADGNVSRRTGKPKRIPKKDRPFCGAKLRAKGPRSRPGGLCRMRVLQRQDGSLARRCRLHGGHATGPRTQEGRRRIGEAVRRRAEKLKAEGKPLPSVVGLKRWFEERKAKGLPYGGQLQRRHIQKQMRLKIERELAEQGSITEEEKAQALEAETLAAIARMEAEAERIEQELETASHTKSEETDGDTPHRFHAETTEED